MSFILRYNSSYPSPVLVCRVRSKCQWKKQLSAEETPPDVLKGHHTNSPPTERPGRLRLPWEVHPSEGNPDDEENTQ